MPRRTERIALTSPAPGTERHLLVHRHGTAGKGRKAYLQAALHADEWPGMLALQHLIGLIDQADAAGAVAGEIVIVPYANPIGLAQRVGGLVMGRYAFDGSGNFNRAWPDFAALAAPELRGKLTGSGPADVLQVRRAFRRAAAGMPRRTDVEELRATLAGLAVDADYVLDIHCDNEALTHLYAAETHRDLAEALGGDLGTEAVFLADDAGAAFDESMMAGWWRLKAFLPEAAALPAACFAATVELRGKDQIDDALARRDARGLFDFLTREGLIAGEPAPPGDPGVVCDLAAVEVVEAPRAGLVVFARELGERVEAGALIAHLVDPAAEDPARARQPVFAAQTGLIVSRVDAKLVRPGERIMKIAGDRPVPGREAGALLED